MKDRHTMARVLTIAGSDSGGGAGIQADLKTITVLKAFGMSVITALTAQNTVGVFAIEEVSPAFVERQIDVVLTDIGADAVKTGMLANENVVSVVAQKMRQYNVHNLVIDPVMQAKSGDLLLSREAIGRLRMELMPLAYIVTPNIPEACLLSGMEVTGLEGMMEAAQHIYSYGPKHVLIKGGHLEGEALDLLFDGRRFTGYKTERIETKNPHGTGCTYSAAIATMLAQGLAAHEAVKRAKEYVTSAIGYAQKLGKGYDLVDHYAFIERPRFEIEMYDIA